MQKSSNFVSEDLYKKVLNSNEQLIQNLQQYKLMYMKEKNKNEALQKNDERSRSKGLITNTSNNPSTIVDGSKNDNKENQKESSSTPSMP